MGKHRDISQKVILVAALLVNVVLCVVLAFVDLRLFFVALGSVLVIMLTLIFDAFSLRSRVQNLFVGSDSSVSAAQRSSLGQLQMPILITDTGGNVLWYNDCFRDELLSGDKVYFERIDTIIPNFSAESCCNGFGQGFEIAKRHYIVRSSFYSSGKEQVYMSVFSEDTELNRTATEYVNTRPCVLLFALDNYDEIMAGARDSDKSAILASADRVLEDFINATNGVLKKLSPTTYFAVIEEQHFHKIAENRFEVLDKIRQINSAGVSLTLSIGAGKGARSLYENQLYARAALDMALGRGGDQAAVKVGKEFTFFGGVNREVERRTRVKARTIASALANVICEAGNVLIMGHRMSDLDSIGAAVGLTRACTACGVKSRIICDEKTTLAMPLINLMREHGAGELFVSPHEAKSLVNEGTLLILLDTQMEKRLEVPEIMQMVDEIVLIDHHRKMVGHIDRAVLFYHEPYASSCCEMVTELLQYIAVDSEQINKFEAVALLAGIMLDTKQLSVRTNVRTFEACAYLRRRGAEPTEAKMMFASDLETYTIKSQLVSRASVYRGCAIVIADDLPPLHLIAAPQAADDLLCIEGVHASIVSYIKDGVAFVSARSLGVYNVQLIMENMGGGGHQTMAGAQLRDVTLAELEPVIIAAIDKYLDSNVRAVAE